MNKATKRTNSAKDEEEYVMAEKIINKQTWVLWLSFIVLAGAFYLQYHIDIGYLLGAWDSEDFSYCYLVPFVFVYLIYVNRKSLSTHELRPSFAGFVVLMLSGVIYLAGKFGSIVTLTYIAIWMVIVGLGLLIFGTKLVKALAFPFLILAFIVPLPPFLSRLFTFKLKLISSDLSVKLMQMCDVSVFREGNVIDLGITQLQVVDACSGLRYVYPLLLMGLIFAYLFHKKWWERAVIIICTVPISVFSNVLRIAITGFLTVRVSPEVAEGFFHNFSGWLIFMVSFVLLIILSWLLRFMKTRFTKETPVKGHKESSGPVSFNIKNIKVPYLWAASVVFVLIWGVHATLASNMVIPERKTFEEFPTEIGKWKGEKTFLRKEILDSLWADDYVQIQFQNEETGNIIILFVPYYEYQGTKHTAHSPVSCLVGGGFAPLSRKILHRKFPAPFGEVEIRQMLLEKDRQLLLSNYWFQQRDRIVLSEYWNKWYLFWDSMTKRRSDGALVRIEMPLRKGGDVEAGQAIMDSFTQELMQLLPEYVPD